MLKTNNSWNRGLTKSTDTRIFRASEKIKEKYKNGLIINNIQRKENYSCLKCTFKTDKLSVFKKHHGVHNKNRKFDLSLEIYKNYGNTGNKIDRVLLKCFRCGKDVFRRKTEVEKYRTKKYFCSEECQFFSSCVGVFIDKKGREHYYKSNYELKALKKLNDDINVLSILTNKLVLNYYENFKKKKYIVDFWVIYKNATQALIEVKSLYTFEQHKKNNVSKFKSAIEQCRDNDCSFKIWCFDNNAFSETVLYQGDEYYRQ